jgi:hypothetical protein
MLLHIATSFRTWIEKSSSTPLSCGVSTPEIKLGSHGPRRDANGAQCFFLLLLSLEESNQRTLRNRNARFNRRPTCRRFRCVRSAQRRESACSLHRNLTPSIEASFRTQPPIPRGAGFPVAPRVGVVGRASARDACSRTCRRHVPTTVV